MGILKNVNSITKTLGFKIFMILILGLLMLVPMEFISSVVRDRKSYQKEAIDSIINPIGGTLKLEGIIIAIPYNVKKYVSNETRITREYIITMPNNYNVEGNADVTTLNRGIFKAPIFSSILKINGTFKPYDETLYNINPNSILWDEAVLIFGVSNKKNFTKLPEFTANGVKLKNYERSTGIRIDFFNNMFFYKIGSAEALKGFDFAAELNVQGGNSIEISPLSSENSFVLSSSWADPSFSGGWLPINRKVTKNGFTAEWSIASFNTSFNNSWTTEVNNYINKQYEVEDKYSSNDDVIVSFLLLNDNYQKTARSLKYRLLFIFIPFFALFLCEILTKKKIHPVQYTLIGLANAIFYLLLLSVSEHIYFNLSYLISAVMVASLTSVYVGYIMKSVKLGIAMALVEIISYMFLFGILQLTDYALLMGVIGLFIAIALAMYFTRNIDWYGEDA